MNKYVSMARPTHWFKNVFLIPGAVFAFAELNPPLEGLLTQFLVAFVATSLVASANYVINEVLDADFDRHHPTKKHRAAVKEKISIPVAYTLYVCLLVVGIVVGFLYVNKPVGLTLVALAVCGVLYNVPPVRLKEKPYVDVLFESLNNIVRLLIGWFSIAPLVIPPTSLVLAFWMAGAFLMSTKRFSEYRFIGDPEKAGLYRKSFIHYNQNRLLLSSLFYMSLFSFFFGIFLFKYRAEFVLIFPLFAMLFTCYMHIAMQPDSSAQNPQFLYREKLLNGILVLIIIAMGALSSIDIPSVDFLLKAYSY